MKNDEVVKTLQQYFSKDGTMTYKGGDETVKVLTELFATVSPIRYNAPDLFFVKDSLVLIVEHFEFDCYQRTRKGSSYRLEEARIEREFNARPMEGDSSVMHATINAPSSYEYYISNVKHTFDEHYARIDTYVQNLTKIGVVREDSKVKVMFLIDDVSPLGTMTVDNNVGWGENDRHPIVLGACKDFLDFLSERQKVDYVLACSSFGSEPYIWFINQNDLKAYQDTAIDYSIRQFIPFTVNVILGAVKVHKEEQAYTDDTRAGIEDE